MEIMTDQRFRKTIKYFRALFIISHDAVSIVFFLLLEFSHMLKY